MKFIGIDLAWTYKNESGICIISDDGRIERLESRVFSDDEIIDIVKENTNEPICLAIDAPIVVNNETGARDAERELMRDQINGHRFSVFVASRRFLERTYGQIRGEIIASRVIKLVDGFTISSSIQLNKSCIVETFPTGICGGLFPDIYPIKYKLKRKTPYVETQQEMIRMLKRLKQIENDGIISGLVKHMELDNIALTKKNHKHIEDKVDGFLTAFGVFSIAKGFAIEKTYGTTEKGSITIPIIKKEVKKLKHKDIEVMRVYLNKLEQAIELDIQLQIKELDTLYNYIKTKKQDMSN